MTTIDDKFEFLSQITLQLLEDLSTPIQPRITYQTISGIPPAPTNIPQTTDLPTKPREFKQRAFMGTLEKLEHLLELKQILIKRKSTDQELRIQFEKEVQKIKNQIIDIKNPKGND